MEKRPGTYILMRIGVYLLLAAAVSALIFFALNGILPGFVQVLENGNQADIENYIRSFVGFRGLLTAFLLQFIQVVSVVFPGGPIQIAAGVVFGFWTGYAVCESSFLLANVAVFTAARRLGSRMERFFSVGSGGKKRLSFISNSKNPGFMVFLGCILPVLPNGIVPYVAARTKIKYRNFALAVFIGSTPTFMVLCALGNRLLQGDFYIVAIIAAVFIAAIVLVYLKRDAFVAFAGRLRDKIAHNKTEE